MRGSQTSHLEALLAVGVRAGVDALHEALEDDGLDVRASQGQNVAQAFVPGVELPQAPRVLAKALSQGEQQLARSVPVN